MTGHAQRFHASPGGLWLCPNCGSVGNDHLSCPACGHDTGGLLNLGAILNREKQDIWEEQDGIIAYSSHF